MTPQNITLPTLYVARRDGQWFIRGLPELDISEAGPYATRAEAEDSRRGLTRYYRYRHLWNFWTTEPQPKRKPPTTHGRTHGHEKQPRPI